jgi:hypothetical protein
MRLFFLTIPKPLKQHPIKKKIIHSAIFKDLEEKYPEGSFNSRSGKFLPEMLSQYTRL